MDENQQNNEQPVTPTRVSDEVSKENLLAALNIHAQREAKKAAMRRERLARRFSNLNTVPRANLAEIFRFEDDFNKDLDNNINYNKNFEKNLFFSEKNNDLLKNQNCKPLSLDNFNLKKDDYDDYDFYNLNISNNLNTSNIKVIPNL